MAQRFVEVRIASPVDAGELLAHLEGEPPLGAWEAEGSVHLYWPEEQWRPPLLAAVRRALERAGFDPAAQCRVEVVEDRDWNALWTRSVAPVRIGRVVVRQSWNPAPLPPGSTELVIDPKRAFGTGHHATTRLLLEALQERIRGGERVLDVGTGSGILAMAALRLGAGAAAAIDSDPEAIECAREYAEGNAFGPELELRVASLETLAPDGGGYDVVIANLDRNTILPHLKLLARLPAPGGWLLLSGLLAEDRAEVAAALARIGAEQARWRAADEWVAVDARVRARGTRRAGPARRRRSR